MIVTFDSVIKTLEGKGLREGELLTASLTYVVQRELLREIQHLDRLQRKVCHQAEERLRALLH